MEPHITQRASLKKSFNSTPSGDARLSAKTREKLEKLKGWRVGASSLKLAAGGPHVEGGFAVVRRAALTINGQNGEDARAAIHKQTGSDVAVKMMKIEDGDDIYQILRRAIREADLIVSLYHENIIKLRGFVEDLATGKIWLIFPWAEMGNVRDYVASEDWSIPERIWLINDVAHGVEYLHSQDPPICHGDLKSVNILVNSQFRAIITDFGSARRVKIINDESKQQLPPVQRPISDQTTLSVEFCQNSNTITFTGTEYTLRWVAPEVLGEEDAGTPADIWSMGWVFYEIMTGSIPFEHLQKDTAIIRHIMKGELPPLKDHDRMSLILELVSVMAKCWEISPEGRPSADRCRKYVSQMPMCAPRGKQSPSTGLQAAGRLFREGMVHKLQNDYDKALAAFKDALKELGDQAMSTGEGGNILWGIAEVYRLRGEYHTAATLYTTVVQLCEAIGSRAGKADAQWGLAEIHRLKRRYDEAIPLYAEVVQMCEEIGDRRGKVDAQLGLASIDRSRAEYHEAAALYREVIQTCEEIGDRRGKADAQWGLAEIHGLRKEDDKAAALFSEIVQIFEELGDRRRQADAQRRLAEIHRARKEYATSLQLFIESSQVSRACGDRAGLISALRASADVYSKQGRFEDARKFHDEAEAIDFDLYYRQWYNIS